MIPKVARQVGDGPDGVVDEYGLVCGDCGTVIEVGDLYVPRLRGMVGEIPSVDLVCADCGVTS